jgi:hypothetical protein
LTQWYTGVGIAESVNDLVQGIQSGNWVDIGLGGLTTGLEALSIAMDPLGSLGSNLVSFIIEHVRPLQDALDNLAGNADAVAAQAQTWRNVAKAVGEVRLGYGQDDRVGPPSPRAPVRYQVPPRVVRSGRSRCGLPSRWCW